MKTMVLERTLLLATEPENPRNSEGDFIRLRNGHWLFVYTRFRSGTGSDHDQADLVSRFSTDEGKTWSSTDRIAVPNEGGFNIMSVTLRRLPRTGEIGLFYLRKSSMRDCRPVLRVSKDEGKTWSAPTEIIPDSEIGYYVVVNDRVAVLPGGRMIVPASLHQGADGDFQAVGRVICYLSDDNGKSWRRNRSALALPVPGSKTGLQEPGVIALRDGRIMLWARTDQGTQWQSYSTDNGETFSAPQPGPLRSPAAPASIKRIPSTGNLLAVWNDNYDPKAASHSGDRTPLAAAISRDDGRSWNRPQILEGEPTGFYCYTAIAFAGAGADETILLAYGTRKTREEGLALQFARMSTAQLYNSMNR